MTLLNMLAVVPFLISVPFTWLSIELKYQVTKLAFNEDIADRHYSRCLAQTSELAGDIEKLIEEID